jgi:adenylyl- and sulfurtransferase ThiI
MPSIVVHYGELALKGRNRPWFTSMLVRTIETVLEGLDVRDVRPVVGRIVIRLGPEGDRQWDEMRNRLSRLPGVGNFARAIHAPPDLDAIADTAAVRRRAWRRLQSHRPPRGQGFKTPRPTSNVKSAAACSRQQAGRSISCSRICTSASRS